MTNFEYLKNIPEFKLFASACTEAERVFSTSAAMCAVGSRKALELAVKWVYSADKTMKMPYRDNIQSLVHEPSFRFALNQQTWSKLQFIIKLGNLAVHTEKHISKSDAVLSLSGLFEFVEWINYCYSKDYVERAFDEKLIPAEKVNIDIKKVKQNEALIEQKDSEIKALQDKISELSDMLTSAKQNNINNRIFRPGNITEYETRKKFIDVDLKMMGWVFGSNVTEEVPVEGMPNDTGQGYVDYVFWGKNGLPLAIEEAKRTSKDPNTGKMQAKYYADCLQKKYGQRPMIFNSNGFDTYFWDDTSSPQRVVSGIFSPDDLQKLMNRRNEKKDLDTVEISDKITDRYYQKAAIRAVCDNIKQGHRRSLLVMATGTGKTRTASSLADVLSRGGYVTNILFLADRTALVKQAKEDFKNYLPDMSLCNLCTNKDDRNARIVFSTYPTMLNAIDMEKSETGMPMFTPAHFDLIIVDEAHRSIFKKYRTIFDYFDAYLVGLTATPKTEVDRNTYDFFEMENGVPTYAYDYDTAVNKDHVLVPYYNIEVKTKFLSEGIKYDDLSDADKERYEDDFEDDETGMIPDFVSSSELNEFVFNQKTVDMVLQDLMTKGIKINGGDRIGKTIIFAQSKRHAQYIVERFDALYPQYNGNFAARVVCDDAYVQKVIDDFKLPASPDPYSPDKEKTPHIAVSVDMMDTGIDVRHVVNLVFFKKICSKTKFWQMIGRGTRLCQGMECIDSVDGAYTDKRRFFIFDYCGNFEFFRQHINGIAGSETRTLTESIFCKRVRLMQLLQSADYAEDGYQSLRSSLSETVFSQIAELNCELVAVRLQRQHIEKFSNKPESLTDISDSDYHSLTEHIAPLVYMNEPDENAKRFDSLIYGLMTAKAEGKSNFIRIKNSVIALMKKLEQKSTIPQIKDKLPLIKRIQTDSFWNSGSIIDYETIRMEIRDLIQFLEREPVKYIYTSLEDAVLDTSEGNQINDGYDFEDYKFKVNKYIETHRDEEAIRKLRNNLPLTDADYSKLNRIFMQELGNEEDYKREFGDTPLGLLVRKIAKLEYDAAMKAFSEFINDQSLNSNQIAFVQKIIDYVVNNGYIESVKILLSPPFDKPYNFMKLFSAEKQQKLITLINSIKENALKTA